MFHGKYMGVTSWSGGQNVLILYIFLQHVTIMRYLNQHRVSGGVDSDILYLCSSARSNGRELAWPCKTPMGYEKKNLS